MGFEPAAINHELKNDPLNKIVFDELGQVEGYLVGGCLRDALLHRQSSDRDYVVRGDMVSLAGRIAGMLGGRSFRLGRYDLLRIVLPDGRLLDFTPLPGTLKDDLMGRDFSINAMAWSPRDGLIDLIGGAGDIRRRVIRAVCDSSLLEDPLRIIRAFRFSQELDFTIDDETLKMIYKHAALLEGVAGERVTTEIIKILNAGDPCGTLEMMFGYGVLRLNYFNNNELGGRIKAISKFQQMVNVLPVKYNFKLNEIVSQGLTRRALIRLALLSAGGHIERLAFSKAIMSRLDGIKMAGEKYDPQMTSGGLFDILEVAGDAAFEFLLSVGRVDLLCEYERFEHINLKPLLSADEVRAASGLEPGPKLGRLIRGLKRFQFAEGLTDKEEARRAAHDMVINRI